MNVAGAVLAGGTSRRYGEPKAFAVYKGTPFYERACQALEPHVKEIAIVAKPEWGTFTDRRVICDDQAFRGKGPLAGIYSAMKEVSAEWYCVLACDMPLMNGETIGRLLQEIEKDSEADVILPFVEDRVQPLAAVYHRRSFKKLEMLLMQEKLRVKDFLNSICVLYLKGLDPNAFQNVNSKVDLANLEKEGRQ